MFDLVLVRTLKKLCNKGGGNRKSSGTFISNTNCRGIEN